MPINVGYGPAAAYGAAAQEVGGADEIMKNRQLAAQTVQQNRALAAQQLNSMISAVMQGRAIDAQQQSADSHTNAQQYATQMGYNASQEHGAAQVVGQQRQQAFQGQQAANQYRQQYALENMRQQGRTERADLRVQSHAELMAMKLSAPEQMDMRRREAAQADADQQLEAGTISPDEHQAWTRRNSGPLQAYRNRAAGYQQGLFLQGQQEQHQQVQQQGELAQASLSSRILRTANGQAVTHPDSGAPMVLNPRTGMPEPMWQPLITSREVAQVINDATLALQRDERIPASGDTPARTRVIQPTPEELDTEVERRLATMRRAMRSGQPGQQQQQGATLPPEQAQRVEADLQAAMENNSRLHPFNPAPGIMAITTVRSLAQRYGGEANMPPADRQRFLAAYAQLRPLLTPQAPAPAAPAPTPQAPPLTLLDIHPCGPPDPLGLRNIPAAAQAAWNYITTPSRPSSGRPIR